MATASSLHEMIAVRPLPGSPNAFEGVHKFLNVSNRPIAFGGCVLTQCISAAYASLRADLPDKEIKYDLYSVVGHFLGPASTEVSTQYLVENVRTTKSFATRKVEAWQSPSKQDITVGNKRRVMILLLDFQVPEKESMFEYSINPLYATSSTLSSSHGDSTSFTASLQSNYSNPELSPTPASYLSSNHTEETAAHYWSFFKWFNEWFDIRTVVASMGVQKAIGMAPKTKTTQDKEPLTRRTNTYWLRMRDPASHGTAAGQNGTEQIETKGFAECSLAFWMDGGLAFLPLTYTHHSLLDVSACASLDLSLRFLRPPNFNEWLLQEQTTEAGTNGRVFGNGRVWDRQGRLTAVMSQVAIMRPWPDKQDPSSKL